MANPKSLTTKSQFSFGVADSSTIDEIPGGRTVYVFEVMLKKVAKRAAALEEENFSSQFAFLWWTLNAVFAEASRNMDQHVVNQTSC